MRSSGTSQEHRRFLLEILEPRTLLSAATVNFNSVYQTMDGFGAQPGIGQNPNPPDSALQLAFSQTNGIGMEFIRGSLSANGYNQIVGMSQRAAAYGVQLVMSPRGPAVAWLDDFGNATNGELDPAHYQDYANMVADFLQNSAAQGIPVDAVSMAVEPDLATTITPVWNGQQFANLLPYFANTFRARGITTKIMVNEDVGWETTDRNQILANPGLSQYVSIVADHGYGQSFNPYQLFSNNMGKQVWMTEDIPQVSTDTQIQNAVLTATDIHNAITVAGASAYLDCFLNFGSQGLMSSWTSPNISLWAMGNYSKFVRPGWVRVGENDDGGVLLTTFKDPISGKFAIVAINAGSTDISESYTLNGLSASSVTPYVTSATSNLSAGGAITVNSGTFSATIPANSIITYYGQSSSAAALQAPVALYAAPVATAQTSQMALSWTDNSASDADYTIQRSTDGTNWTTVTSTVPAGTTTYVDTGLSEATTYYYRVQATNGGMASAFSTVAMASTILAAPTNVTSTGTSGGRNLTWTINSLVSTGVTIQRSTDGLIWSTIATLNSRIGSYSDTIPSYNANEIYWYRVRNTRGSQASAYGAYNTTVNTPTNFTATLASPTSVTLRWNNTAIGAYAAYINQNNSLISPPNLSANAGTFTATGLAENTSYTFTIQALGPEAWFRPSAQITYGAWSSAAAVSITTRVAPPMGLTAVSNGAGTATLNWIDNSAVETAYDVERSTNGSTWTVLSSLMANITTYPDTSVPSGTVYYRVKAVDSSASSAYVRTQLVSALPTITTNATVAGTTTSLSTAAPSGFGSGTLVYTWSLAGTPPGTVNFPVNGTSGSSATTATFVAAGSYMFRVTIADSLGDSTTATSTVTVNQTLTSITVTDTSSPASFSGPAVATPAIVKSTWQQLAATGLDQFGTSLAVQPTFTWSVVSGGGAVSSTGLYTAPANAASPVVRAVSGSISGQVTLSVLTTAQLVADYSFNETSGYQVQDVMGAGVTGYVSGGASLVAGRLGNAVQLDGVSGSVWLGNPQALDIRGQITMAAWIKPMSTAGTQMIVGRAVAHYPNQSATYLRISGGQYQVGFYNSSYGFAAYTMPGGDVGQWVHLVGTYDGKNWNLYRDGTLVATYANSRGSTYVPESWRVGSTDQPDSYFSGQIDSVRLYAQALPAAAVTSLYNQSIVITTVASASATTITNATTNLSVAAVDPDTNSDALFTYTWSMTSGPASVNFSVNSSNAAKNTTATFTAPGSYTFKATVQDVSGLTTTSSVTVAVVDTLTSITVVPANPTMPVDEQLQFAATAYDQFNAAMGTQPSFAWSVASDGGSVTSSGLYTAPGTSTAATAQAQASGVNGSASVTVSSSVDVYQAEAATYGGGVTTETLYSGFDGTGYANFPTSGGTAQWNNIDGGEGGASTIQFRYALISGTRAGLLTVNGIAQPITFQSTASWSTWGLLAIPVTLNAGTVNTVVLQSTGQDLANVDELQMIRNGADLPSWMGGGSAASWNPATKVLNVSGVASIIADPGIDEPIIQGNTLAAQISVNPSSGNQIHIGGVNLSNGAWLTITSLGAARTASNHRVLIVGTGSSPTFSIDATSTIDLTDNDLIVRGGDLAGITNQLLSGYNRGGGYWNGHGIISSTVAHDLTFMTTQGVLQNTTGSGVVYNTFDGVTGLTTSDVLVKYTYYGDADLSGSVTGQDYSIVDAHNGKSGMIWSQGDFNDDGIVDGSDYSLIDNAFNQQGSGGLTSPLSQTAGPSSLPAVIGEATLSKAFQSKQPSRHTVATPLVIFSLPAISPANNIFADDSIRDFWEQLFGRHRSTHQ